MENKLDENVTAYPEYNASVLTEEEEVRKLAVSYITYKIGQ